jgi:large subunit ribosomal protein L6
MSRVGKKPVTVPSGVTANVQGQTVSVKGPKGTLSFVVDESVAVVMDKGAIKVDPRNETKRARAMWGTSRALIDNMMTGVTKGFEKKLEINGVGYRHRPAQGRTGCGGDPQIPFAGALQGQGREIR